MKVTQLCLTLCDPMDSPRSSPGKNTGVGRLSLLQGIFPPQGSNPGLPHCRWILYELSHKGSVVDDPSETIVYVIWKDTMHKEMADGGSLVLTVGVEVMDKEGEIRYTDKPSTS